jgi:two-component system, chemotaxis family, protein-glutamate methylesterase/glutaminase
MPRRKRGILSKVHIPSTHPMSPVRVLVVDGSIVVRKLLCEALASSPEVQLAGTAASGSLALMKIPQLNPDVVTLDIEMPGLDGLQTLKEIRRLYPRLPVIMFSTLSERGATVTLEALAMGASDFATKPRNGDMAGAQSQVRDELIDKIILLGRRTGRSTPAGTPSAVRRASKRPVRGQVSVLAIGASTGGPNALAEVIPRLPGDFPVPVVIVQHMPPLFTRLLADRLNTQSSLRVHEAEAGAALEPGQVWIARGDYHLAVAQKSGEVVIELNQDPPENSCRPAVDVLFRSIAHVYGPSALALVMTGMGSDGARGAELIRNAGGEVLVQDEPSSVVWGMPGAVVGAGAADKICPLPEISLEVVRRVAAGRASSLHAAAAQK